MLSFLVSPISCPETLPVTDGFTLLSKPQANVLPVVAFPAKLHFIDNVFDVPFGITKELSNEKLVLDPAADGLTTFEPVVKLTAPSYN